MTTKINGTTGIEFPDNTIRGSGSLLAGNFKNLAANANGLNATVNVTADAVVLEKTDFSPIIARAVSRAINTAANGVDGLDTGAIAASTWYYIWIISDGINVRALASLSSTAPTMPAGYTYKARVGSFRTDGTANKYPLGFQQYGAKTQYKTAAGSNLLTLPTMASGSAGSASTPTWVAVPVANFVPPTASEINTMLSSQTAAGTEQAIAAPNNVYGGFSSTTNPPPAIVSGAPGVTAGAKTVAMILESANIFWGSNQAAGLLQCAGYTDNF